MPVCMGCDGTAADAAAVAASMAQGVAPPQQAKRPAAAAVRKPVAELPMARQTNSVYREPRLTSDGAAVGPSVGVMDAHGTVRRVEPLQCETPCPSGRCKDALGQASRARPRGRRGLETEPWQVQPRRVRFGADSVSARTLQPSAGSKGAAAATGSGPSTSAAAGSTAAVASDVLETVQLPCKTDPGSDALPAAAEIVRRAQDALVHAVAVPPPWWAQLPAVSTDLDIDVVAADLLFGFSLTSHPEDTFVHDSDETPGRAAGRHKRSRDPSAPLGRGDAAQAPRDCCDSWTMAAVPTDTLARLVLTPPAATATTTALELAVPYHACDKRGALDCTAAVGDSMRRPLDLRVRRDAWRQPEYAPPEDAVASWPYDRALVRVLTPDTPLYNSQRSVKGGEGDWHAASFAQALKHRLLREPAARWAGVVQHRWCTPFRGVCPLLPCHAHGSHADLHVGETEGASSCRAHRPARGVCAAAGGASPRCRLGSTDQLHRRGSAAGIPAAGGLCSGG